MIISNRVLIALSCFTSVVKLLRFRFSSASTPVGGTLHLSSFSGKMFSWCRHYRAHMWIRAVAEEKWIGMRAGFVQWGFISTALASTWLLTRNVNKPWALTDTWIQHEYFPHLFVFLTCKNIFAQASIIKTCAVLILSNVNQKLFSSNHNKMFINIHHLKERLLIYALTKGRFLC